MCILVVCKPDSIPSREDLHNGACSNPHGFGFAIETPDGIISERSMSAKKSIARFLELREQYPNGYAMWHARYATHGVKNELNCHPFKVAGTGHDTYLAHNGVLDIHIPKGDKRSDTRIMAEELLPRLGGVSALDDDYVYDMVSSWSSGSKVVIMTRDPSAKYGIYIINEHLGSWDDDGIWWSNQSHKRSKPTPRTQTYDDKYGWGSYDWGQTVIGTPEPDDEASIYPCGFCTETVDLDENPYFCEACMSCLECGFMVTECMCLAEDEKEYVLTTYNLVNDYLVGSNKWYSVKPLDL